MTISDTALPPVAPPRAALPGSLRIGGRVLVLALPLMVGSLAAAGQAVAKLGLLTYTGETEALYLFSMIQPGFILMLAFMESLAIANQVFSSKSTRTWSRGDIRRASTFFSVLGCVLIVLVAAAIWGAQGLLPADGVVAPVLPKMTLFVLSYLPFFVFEVRNAALRGQGRTGLALVPFAVLIAVDLAVTAVCILEFDLGFDALLIGNVAGPLVAYPLTWLLLARTVGPSAPAAAEDYRRNLVRMLIGVAAPTFLTTFAGSIAAMVIFPMLARLGEEAVSSFLIVVRLRLLFVIPAVAAGSAIAILVNRRGEGDDPAESRRVLLSGAVAIAGLYVAATAALYAGHPHIAAFMVPGDTPELRAATEMLLLLLLPTFFLVAVGTMLQVVLEHLGRGVFVLAATLVTEGLTVGAAVYLLRSGGGLAELTAAMVAAAALATTAFAVFFVRLAQRQDTPRHAV